MYQITDIIKEVEEIKPSRLRQQWWPKVEITEHQIVVGLASKKVLRFVIKIREIRKDLKSQIRRCNELPQQSQEEFYNHIISPLKDMLVILDSLFKLQLRLEFPELMDKADIGVGLNGQAFWCNTPGKDPYSCGYKQLVNNIGNESPIYDCTVSDDF